MNLTELKSKCHHGWFLTETSGKSSCLVSSSFWWCFFFFFASGSCWLACGHIISTSALVVPLPSFLCGSISLCIALLRIFVMAFRALLKASQFSHSVVSDSLRPHMPQHARLPCPLPTTGACSNSCPWVSPIISSSLIPFSSCHQSFPASGSYPVSQFFISGGQSTRVSASVLPINIQDWFPLGLTGLVSLQPKGFSRVFSNTTVWKYQFFSAQLSLWSNSLIHTWPPEKP